MAEKFTASEWATMEGGHSIEDTSEKPFAFLKDMHETRMTKDNGSSQKLTYTDCGERLYLSLLVLEVLRKYQETNSFVRTYAKKTTGFGLYKHYRIMGTDLYNFAYFVMGDDSAQKKLKDPNAAVIMKGKANWPRLDINRYIENLAGGRPTTLVTKLLIGIEDAAKISNADYKGIRRKLQDFDRLTSAEKTFVITRLTFAVRAKLRNSDIIDTWEKFIAAKNYETPNLNDPEPVVSTPDLPVGDMALYRYVVGSKNLALTKRFLQHAKDGKSASPNMVAAYRPAIDMIDDIVQGGPAYVQQLRVLQQRAKQRK